MLVTARLLKRLFVFGFSVSLVSTLISLLAGEFIVKHVMPQETYPLARAVGLSIFEPSPVIPFTLKPYVDRFLHIAYTREFTHFVSTNSFGIRGAEFPEVKPETRYRILFLGDSITFGWGVEDDQTYPALVEKYLTRVLNPNGTYQRVEAINAGFTSGNSLDTFFVYYNGIGSKFKPDLVIVDFHPFNDIADMFEHSWDATDEQGYPAKISSTTHVVRDGYLVGIKKTKWKFEIPVLRNSHLGILFLNALEKGTPELTMKIKKTVGVPDEPDPYTFDENIRCVRSLEQKYCPDVLWPFVDKASFILKGFREKTSENKQELLITLMPGPHQVKDLRPRAEKKKEAASANPQKYYREFLEKEKIPTVDLLPAFLDPNPEDIFFALDGHIKRSGHLLVAQEIIAYLQKTKPNLFPTKIEYDE